MYIIYIPFFCYIHTYMKQREKKRKRKIKLYYTVD